MMNNLVVLITMGLVGLALVSARPQNHFMDGSNQDLSSSDVGMPMISPEAMAHLKLGLWRMLIDAQAANSRVRAAKQSEHGHEGHDQRSIHSDNEENIGDGEVSEVSGEEGNGNGNPSQALSSLTDLQLELIAQRLADYNNQLPLGLDRNLLRSPEMKRASRFRQCYFNPVSCFKK